MFLTIEYKGFFDIISQYKSIKISAYSVVTIEPIEKGSVVRLSDGRKLFTPYGAEELEKMVIDAIATTSAPIPITDGGEPVADPLKEPELPPAPPPQKPIILRPSFDDDGEITKVSEGI